MRVTHHMPLITAELWHEPLSHLCPSIQWRVYVRVCHCQIQMAVEQSPGARLTPRDPKGTRARKTAPDRNTPAAVVDGLCRSSSSGSLNCARPGSGSPSSPPEISEQAGGGATSVQSCHSTTQDLAPRKLPQQHRHPRSGHWHSSSMSNSRPALLLQ